MKTNKNVIIIILGVVILVLGTVMYQNFKKENLKDKNTVSDSSDIDSDILPASNIPSDASTSYVSEPPVEHTLILTSENKEVTVSGYVQLSKENYGDSFIDIRDTVSSSSDIAFSKVEFHKGNSLRCSDYDFDRCILYLDGILGVKGKGKINIFFDFLVNHKVYGL